MRIEDLQVELRPRSPWEAVELGMALARRHAAAVWAPWLVLTLPVFALANAVGWWLDAVPLAALLMWWLKPVFDRVPLYVLSRAVFGATPGLRDTLRAQAHWGRGALLHHLTWRRLSPVRALFLPVDLLEGGAHGSERRRVIGGHARGTATLLTLVCVHFEMALGLASVLLVLAFVPFELLTESARAMWALLAEQPPRWAQVALNAAAWLATSLIEPFYVAGGFGLYLNRRTQLEAWDVEIAFRRLGKRLAAAAPVLALAVGLACVGPVRAQSATPPASPAPAAGTVSKPKSAPPAVDLREVFGERYVPVSGGWPDRRAPAPGRMPTTTRDAAGVPSQDTSDADSGTGAAGAMPPAARDFGDAVRGLARDPLLHPRERRTGWQLRDPRKPADPGDAAWAAGVGRVLAVIGEFGLWIVLAIGVAVLLWTAPRWWPAVRETATPRRPPSCVSVEAEALPDALPADVAATARALFASGRVRAALALVYRAAVEGMVARTGATLVPGATEAECLRASRALADTEDRAAFAQAVRVWQHAAYAQRPPTREEFDALLGRLALRFGWAA